jgi:hypothetical protein
MSWSADYQLIFIFYLRSLLIKNIKNIMKKYIYGFSSLAVLATLATAVPAFADNTAPLTPAHPGAWFNARGGMMKGRMMKPAVFGTVSAVSGNIITVSGKQGFGTNAVSVTFTVDATNAKIMKDGSADAPTIVTISSINVGDRIMAQGTLTGTNLVATMIRDGRIPVPEKGNNGSKNPSVSPIAGDGNPIVAGTVSAVNGSVITITNKSNVTYTINASGAKIVKGSSTVLVSDIAVGDMIVVQGTINGNAVVATSVIDQAKPTSASPTSGEGEKGNGGFFGGIGAFFSHLFGF